jgi:outer membrane protein
MMSFLSNNSERSRKAIALALCCVTTPMGAWAQDQSIEPEKSRASVLVRPYLAAYVPPVRLANSRRLQDLVRAGKLYLTVQDAIALAVENNIDVEVARYNPIADVWALERAEAGGALPGVPSGASQATSSTSGQGVAGSQAAAGVKISGGAQNAGNTANATISQIGPVTPNLDPVFQDTASFSHQSQPQPNARQSEVVNLVSSTRIYNVSLNEGFISGGSATLTYRSQYLDENAPTDVLNPSVAPTLTLSVQHNFLQGFGPAVNSRTITVARSNLNSSDLNFRSQLIGVIVNVLNLYYGLAADYEDVRAKERGLTVAQQFYENNKKQVELGTMAPLDITTAEAQVASSQQDLVVSQTNLQQEQVQLKNVLSRRGLADPTLTTVQIVPIDHIVVPEKDDLPPLKDLIATALKSRTDIAAEKINLINAQTSALGTENGVLPQLAGIATLSQAGLAGTPRTVIEPGQGPGGSTLIETADPYFVGGLGNALGQMFRRNFPSERAGAFFLANLRNRTAQADYAVDQLSLRQSQLSNQRDLNQIAVDVSNQVVGLRQARVRYESAVKNRVLEQQLLEAEQKKFSLGASTSFLVVTQQRDLATAQSNEVAALVAYSNARVTLDQILGTTLEENHVSVREALAGSVARPSLLPASLPTQP